MKGTPAVIGLALALALAGCRLSYLPEIPYVNSLPPAALARLVDGGGRIVGNAVLSQESGGVRILLDVIALPSGNKAVRLHQVGRCEAPSFESAGEVDARVTLPDLAVDGEGKGHLEVTARGVSLDKGSFLIDADRAALVVHDGTTRIACGIIAPEGRR